MRALQVHSSLPASLKQPEPSSSSFSRTLPRLTTSATSLLLRCSRTNLTFRLRYSCSFFVDALWRIETIKCILGGPRTFYSSTNGLLTSTCLIRSCRLGMQIDVRNAVGASAGLNGRRFLCEGVHTDTSSLSKLIPKHVATRGILKKERFSENQAFFSNSGQVDAIPGRKESKDSLLAFANLRRPKTIDDASVSLRNLSEKQVFEKKERLMSRKYRLIRTGGKDNETDYSSSHIGEIPQVRAPKVMMRNMKEDCEKQCSWKNETTMHENTAHSGDKRLERNVFSDRAFQANVKFQSISGEVFHKAERNGRFVTYKFGFHNSKRKVSINNEAKKREKNILKITDLSLAPIKGEPHSEYIIRRKSVMNEAQSALMDEIDDHESIGDDWIRKRIGWLCKEVPVLKASGIVKILNKQRKWIKQEHVIELIDHLIRLVELNRSHKVLKWMQHQPFYKFDYGLHNNMAYILGRNNKVSRCQDVFDEIVRNGKFPDGSVFTALIKAYLHESDEKYVDNAWKLYKQMLQLGLSVSPNLSETLMKSLLCPTGRWLQQAEELLEKMKDSGYHMSEGIYTSLLEIYGKRGDHQKIDVLVTEISDENIGKDVNILNTVLAACAKDGNIKKAEQTWEEIIELGLKPNWRTYSYLIQVYGKANAPMKAWRIFNRMKAENIAVNVVTYQAIIDVMAKDGTHIDRVLQLLKEIEYSELRPLQPAFNTVMSMYLGLKMYKEVEDIFERGKAAKARPSHAAFNMLISSYIERGQLENAESVFQKMKNTDGMGPNSRTFNLLLKGYGIGCFRGRVKEIFEEMTSRGCQVDSDVMTYIQSMVGVKQLKQLEKQKLKLTDEQREIIPGLLLGGAMIINPDGDHNYELRLEFDLKNHISKAVRDHVVFLFQSWWKNKEIFMSCEDEQTHSVSSITSSVAQLETVSHSSLKFYANQYRPNGIPAIPRLIHRWLRPRTLAYWYMYGGHRCPTTGGIVLNASNYPAKQIQLVVKTLKARTIDCKRKKRRNGNVIRFEGKSSIWLWKLMEPHVLDSVRDQLKPKELSAELYNPVDGACEMGDSGSSDEDDWEDLEMAKSSEETTDI